MKFKIGLIWRIVIAIALAVLLGTFVPKGFVRLFATFNDLFSNFLSFIVPLIIIAFIAPGIAKLGKGSGKMLGIAAVAAYSSTIIAGFLAFFVGSSILPSLLGGKALNTLEDPSEALAKGFFELAIPAPVEIMTALVLAFVLGIGMASIGSRQMLPLFDEFNAIIEKVISYVIIPLLPFHIFGIFLNMTYGGQVAKVLSVFAVVFVLILILHFTMLLIQYFTAGTLLRKNPFFLLKTMAPAYMTALGTQSSAATIPVTLRQARKTGASARVTDFAVPLFATIHLSGSTITIITCAIGVMILNGQAIVFASFLPFIFMLGVMMIAAPGVPGGAVMTAIGLLGTMLHFDQTMIALMIALYMAQDSFGTATNVTGDGALAIIVDKFTNDVDGVPAESTSNSNG
ncbi:dicarboxylate/amino acid:cation symporter [Sporosarcina sp. JAI121]|uniref:dicarboxylate/amino acid:cation symporter n=1 Tax=Sporosarcina sp. JAI121 TaxID=2723064 RepID=UPI0015C96C48|nr:dicarboxylate/amino acid:cation symporter [Sporosarcina sp. JAI121]NYF26165.1 Na+/H+-dicarboxylate symporter [Sporosarcina sp. JAI121]